MAYRPDGQGREESTRDERSGAARDGRNGTAPGHDGHHHGRVPVLALAADVVGVVVFAAIGRESHAEAGDLFGLLATAGPFLAGLAVAWAVPLVRARPVGLRAGAVVLAGAAVLGLLIRAAFTGRLPLTFVLVTIVSLAVLLVGWRAVAAIVARFTARRSDRAPG